MTKVRETLNGIFLRAIQVSRSSETYTNFAGLPHRCFHHLSIKYGPVVLLHRGFVPMVVISSSEAAEEDLKTHDLGCCSRPRTVGTGKLSYGRHSTGPVKKPSNFEALIGGFGGLPSAPALGRHQFLAVRRALARNGKARCYRAF
ncbi:unnamed protein product [Arabidopsis lyrata]|nr:unnamed protein product [Arabidopsis lyrata]